MKLVHASLLSTLLIQTSAFAADSNAWNKATAIYNSGDYVRALAAFKNLESAYPKNGRLHYMIGVCYKKCGKLDQARQELGWVATSCKDTQVRTMASTELTALDRPVVPAGFVSTYNGPGKTLINDSVNQTVQVAAQSGYKPCTNPQCLNFSKQGWEHKQIAGHPASDVWMTWTYKVTNADGQWTSGNQSYNQQHLGRLISAPPTQQARDIGQCPVCKGTGWIKK